MVLTNRITQCSANSPSPLDSSSCLEILFLEIILFFIRLIWLYLMAPLPESFFQRAWINDFQYFYAHKWICTEKSKKRSDLRALLNIFIVCEIMPTWANWIDELAQVLLYHTATLKDACSGSTWVKCILEVILIVFNRLNIFCYYFSAFIK